MIHLHIVWGLVSSTTVLPWNTVGLLQIYWISERLYLSLGRETDLSGYVLYIFGHTLAYYLGPCLFSCPITLEYYMLTTNLLNFRKIVFESWPRGRFKRVRISCIFIKSHNMAESNIFGHTLAYYLGPCFFNCPITLKCCMLTTNLLNFIKIVFEPWTQKDLFEPWPQGRI